MSNLLTEINRMRSLMGIKNPINESYLNNRVLLKENTGIGELMNLYKGIFKKGAKSLTSEESKYLKGLIDEYNLRFPDNTIKFQNGLDNIGLKMLSDFINKETDDIITNVFERSIKNINASDAVTKLKTTDDILKQELLKSKVNVGLGEINSTMDFLTYVQKNGNGDITKTELPFDLLVIAKEEMLIMSAKLKNYPNDPVKKYIDDLIEQIDEIEGKSKVSDPEIINSLPEIRNSLPISSEKITDNKILNNKEISDKLSNLANSDQAMRQGNDMDINIDITNQNELKKLMGEDKEGFIKNLENFEDLRNLWLIIQHSDNDIQLQKDILDILKNNRQTLETKFPSNSKDIKSGIAMLDDRIMVNSNTSVSGYRDTGMDDFGDLSKGKQTYGSQGGINENGEWIPRPIELDGKLYFFETQQELLNNTEFLNKLNAKRSEMGLVPMEDYLKTFNDPSKFIEDPSEIILTKGDEGLQRIFKKQGMFYSEGIEIIRNLTNNFLKDYQKLYKEGAPAKEIQDYLNALNLLKEKFGENKLYSGSIDGGSGTRKITLNDFISDVDQNYKRLYDENGNWSPLNKLDTNWNDMPIEITKFIKTILSEEEYDNFLKKINDYYNSKTEADKLKLKNEIEIDFNKIKEKMSQSGDYVKDWIRRVDEVTKNIKKNTEKGNLSETEVNKLFEANGINVEYAASEGSPIDVLLSIDGIVNDTKGIFNGTPGRKTVQTKTAQKIEEGEFEILEDGTRGQWVAKPGTGNYRIEIMPKQNIYKSSQIDLAGFHDPNSGITIITGKKPTLVRDANDKVIYDEKRFPIYNNNRLTLPGAKLDNPKPGERTVNFYIDGTDNVIVNK